MTTFVNEQVKKLDTALSRSFEKNLQGTKIVNLSSLGEKDQFLFQASQALDFSGNSLPSFEKVQEYLEKYGETFNQDNKATAELEWLFIAKCTIAIYGQVFSKVLNLTLPISESIDYWNGIHGNTVQEIYYALQVAPFRIFTLLKNTVKNINNTSTAIQEAKSLFSSSDFILTQLFPIHSTTKASTNSIATNRTQPFNALKFFTLSTFHNRPLILEIIRDEVDLKKKSLQKFRSQQAASLGILLLTPPEFNQEQGEFASSVASQARTCIKMIKYVMEPPLDDGQDGTLQQKNVHHLQKRLDSMSDIHSSSASDVTMELRSVVKNWSSGYHHNLKCVQSSYGVPSVLTRYWIPAVVSYFAGNWAIRYGFKRKEDIMYCLEELGKTGHDFILNWVWEPVRKVYETIRLKDQRLSILSKQGLQSDLDSLERMVVGFAKDNLHLSELDLSRLVIDIREGDMSVLLKEYEKEIKNPLKNVIAGDLLQTILIQVQKTKVDVDLAMSALDKLLKSNELNFAFLAVAPSMLLTWASASWFKNTLQGRSQQKIKKTGLPMRETLRRIERQLILNESTQDNELSEWNALSGEDCVHQTECETQGILLCEVHLLRAYASTLPLKNSTRARFMEDVRDLENPNLSSEQKIQTIARMNRFWSFL
ncbi:ATP synthase regulation protein NCA2-domain-containing protein [Mucor mucedo]|uniref:ATP synthase regulation protein NCA2-domain-containing protein n=1 Tax=Mucor mucedo TaxID=29922 RepID=UPI00221FD398|nr:ATP synthase regulation protein NCA2-domain-containing protein [Mucor mucedo]KAI7889453.1 ATP synthase regulation protein NCA2-domain-containing protein [Mucor mucedo]